MKKIALVVLLAAAGCGKKAPDCHDSIAKGIENITAKAKSRAPSPQLQESILATMEKLRTTVTQRCVEDKWPAEVVQCFTKITGMKEMQDCQVKLNQEQRSKLSTEIRTIMLNSRPGRMPDVPGHPPTLTGSGGSGAGGAEGPAGAPGATPAGSAAPSSTPASGGSPATPPAPAGAAPATPPAPAGAAPATPPAPAGSASKVPADPSRLTE